MLQAGQSKEFVSGYDKPTVLPTQVQDFGGKVRHSFSVPTKTLLHVHDKADRRARSAQRLAKDASDDDSAVRHFDDGRSVTSTILDGVLGGVPSDMGGALLHWCE